MSGHRVVCTIAALAAVLTLGCSGGMVRDPMRPGNGFGGPVRLTVENNDFNDAVVYANWQGSVRHRVGLFTGKTKQTVTLEWRGDVVQFEVDFIAGSAFFIDPIDVQAGDHLDIVLMAESSKRRYGASPAHEASHGHRAVRGFLLRRPRTPMRAGSAALLSEHRYHHRSVPWQLFR